MAKKTLMEKMKTGALKRQRLKPAARMAINSLSNDNRLKVEIDAIRQAIGRVKTKNEGIKYAIIFTSAHRPMPFETKRSMSRSISLAKMMKHSAVRVEKNGENNSRMM